MIDNKQIDTGMLSWKRPFGERAWGYDPVNNFTIATPQSANGAAYADKDYYWLGSDGYIYRYTKDWVFYDAILHAADHTYGYTYIRGIGTMPDIEPDVVYIAAGGSLAKLTKQSLSTGETLASIRLTYEVRGLMIKDNYLYIGQLGGTSLRKYDANLVYLSQHSLSGLSGTMYGVLNKTIGFYVFTTKGCFEYDDDFGFVGQVFTYSLTKGVMFKNTDDETTLYATANGTSIKMVSLEYISPSIVATK